LSLNIQPSKSFKLTVAVKRVGGAGMGPRVAAIQGR
jgi:hypothetical protein